MECDDQPPNNPGEDQPPANSATNANHPANFRQFWLDRGANVANQLRGLKVKKNPQEDNAETNAGSDSDGAQPQRTSKRLKDRAVRDNDDEDDTPNPPPPPRPRPPKEPWQPNPPPLKYIPHPQGPQPPMPCEFYNGLVFILGADMVANMFGPSSVM